MIKEEIIKKIIKKNTDENDKKIKSLIAVYLDKKCSKETLEDKMKLAYVDSSRLLKKKIKEACNENNILWSDADWENIDNKVRQQFSIRKALKNDTSQSESAVDNGTKAQDIIDNPDGKKNNKELDKSDRKKNNKELDNLEGKNNNKELGSPDVKKNNKELDNVILEARIENIINKFEGYHLSETSKTKLRGYFRYLMKKEKYRIRYNFIICSDDDDRAMNFIKELCKQMDSIKGKNSTIMFYGEKELLSDPILNYIESDDIIVIKNLLEDADYYLNDFDEQSLRSRKITYDSCWEGFSQYVWNMDKTFILCGPERIIENRIKNHPKLYYNFFTTRLYIGNVDADELYWSVINELKVKTSYTEKFQEELKIYIDTIYTRARLKGRPFVADLVDCIIRLAYENNEYDLITEKSIPFYHKNMTFEALDSEFQNLVGLTEVKEKVRDIGLLCKTINTGENPPRMHMIFRGNPGTGKTTVARLIAKLLNSMNIIKNDKLIQVMASDLIAGYVGQTAIKTRNAIERAAGGVLFVDEAYMLNSVCQGNTVNASFREEAVAELIKAMEKSDPVFIFAGYPNEMDEFVNTNPGLKSRIGFTLEFKDYDSSQLLEIFQKICKGNGYSFDEKTIEAVDRKITALSYNDNFGNAREVENVFNQAVIESMRNGRKDRFISAEDIIIDKRIKTYEELMAELNGRVGILKAKNLITEQVESNKFCKENGIKSPSSNNMIFVGNAGTGKTTTAKIFAELLFSIGIAKSPKIKVITARDLFIQNVSEKLSEFFREAMGGVLFIDEIYLLQNHIYHCTEVVSVLLEKVENNREDITVILSGYERQMEKFLGENQGLASRFPIVVHFDDFSEDELVEIFIQNCKENGMTVNDAGIQKFREVIQKEMAKGNFGNGRSVRNIFEQAFRKHAVNYYDEKYEGAYMISADDIEYIVSANENGKKIGFNVK